MYIKELERLKAVARFLKLEGGKQEELQALVQLTAAICGMPVARITLLDENTEYITYSFGSAIKEIPRDQALCNHIIDQDHVVVIRDTAKDNRFYAGVPLKTKEGYNIGTLCVINEVPADLSEMQP